jgi:hypothetical protein
MISKKETRIQKYEALVEKGCLCGTDRSWECKVHSKPTDNRGLRAFFEAGMPLGFPMVATCAICGDEGLMYPDIEAEDVTKEIGPAESRPPTLVCPRCSQPVCERRLRTEAVDFGYTLNSQVVFAT